MSPIRTTHGFSLIELLVSISVATIMLTVAVPSFRDFLLNTRLTTQANELSLALAYAKSEAVKRNAIVTVLKNADATTACAGGATGWSKGWTLFIDADSDRVIDTTEVILRVWPTLGSNTLCFNAGSWVEFQRTGSTSNIGTFRFCDSRGAIEAHGLVLSMLGRVRHTTDSNADSIEDVSGINLLCP
jgi:type IV fimbrial biogenesis protein FimT